MSWKVRHEGSPKHVEVPSLDKIVDGLQNGRWEPTDEVMGPGEADWTAVENHPQLAEVAAEIEPPEPPHEEDETHLDMNALIDVCLVLLVFFILTTSYAALQKILELPTATADEGRKGIRVIKQAEAEETMIPVSAKMTEQGVVITVAGQPVALDDLQGALTVMVQQSKKARVLLDHDGDVPHGVVVAIQDKAKLAGVDRILLRIPRPAGSAR